jgi:molecular chaperone GrpE
MNRNTEAADMAEHHRNSPPDVPRREPVQEDAIADGDAQLDREPPNVTEAEPAPGTGNKEEGSQDDDDAAPEAELAQLRREFAGASDRYLRLAAEYDNFRKRSERERAELWVRAQADLAGRTLDALDDLERVSQHAAGATVDSLLEGVRLVERKLRSALTAAGLEPVDAEGAAFDPNSMEAVAMVGTHLPEEDDLVSDVFQRGYTFRGTLLRPARVRVKKHGA